MTTNVEKVSNTLPSNPYEKVLAERGQEDKGKHYRHSHNGVKIDPYRVILVYHIVHPTHQHMLKKLMRSDKKGHSEVELVDELQCCLDRWKELQIEEGLRGSDR